MFVNLNSEISGTDAAQLGPAYICCPQRLYHISIFQFQIAFNSSKEEASGSLAELRFRREIASFRAFSQFS
jgi:hypothetical protein